uniref:Uncharacterized protein n=1 Tax=Glossina palpalis gambiensis TaxID=67801 RepID=A0A1B0BP43_9MUSC
MSISIRLTCYIVGLFLAALTLLTVKLITSIVLGFEHCANATVLLLFFAAAKLNRTLNAFIAPAVFEPAVQCVRI